MLLVSLARLVRQIRNLHIIISDETKLHCLLLTSIGGMYFIFWEINYMFIGVLL
jgi:hypothetical protein